jgi:hypothetical protein
VTNIRISESITGDETWILLFCGLLCNKTVDFFIHHIVLKIWMSVPNNRTTTGKFYKTSQNEVLLKIRPVNWFHDKTDAHN